MSSAAALSAPAASGGSGRRAAVSGLAVALVALAALGVALGFRAAGPLGPQGSAYATGPQGFSRWAAALAAQGRTVGERRQPLDLDEPVDPRATLVVLDAPRLAPEEGAAIRRFLAHGGRAVVGGVSPNAWLPQVLDDAPRWIGGGRAACHRLVAVPEARTVSDVVLAGSGHFADQGSTLAFLACGGVISATVASPYGASGGRLVLLADTAPLQNRFLTARDDLALALGVVGDRNTVVFDEQVHGFGDGAGVLALPQRARTGLLVLLLAGGVAAAAVRTGLPASRVRQAPKQLPARAEFVAALGRRVERSRPLGSAAVPVQREARQLILALAGAGEVAGAVDDDEAVRRAAEWLGLAPSAVAAVLRPPRRRSDVIEAVEVLRSLRTRGTS